MKAVVTGDLHLHDWPDKVVTDEGKPLKLIEILRCFTQMCNYAIKNKINNVIILGDVNHTKDKVSTNAFVLFQRLLDEYSQLTFWIIDGNHDKTGRRSSESAIELLNGPNVNIFLKPEEQGNIFWLPYAVSEELGEQIEECSDNVEVVFAHFGLNEAKVSSGRSLRSKIGMKNISKFKLVISGHYHKPQSLSTKNTKFYYVGSLIQLRRDEKGEEKRFLVVDTDTFNIESIPTTGYRMYHEFVLDDINTVKDTIQKAKELRESGHHVTIRKLIKEIPSELIEEMGIIDDYEEEAQTRGITSSMEIKSQMEKYLEIKNIPKEEWNEYLEIGIEGLNTSLEGEEDSIKTKTTDEKEMVDDIFEETFEEEVKEIKPKTTRVAPPSLSDDIDFNLPEVDF